MKLLLTIAHTVSLLTTMTTTIVAQDQVQEFRVAGYLPDYRFADFNLQLAAGLTDLILFSAEPQESGGLDVGRLKNCPLPKLRQFKTEHRIRLILAIGGWERSGHFAAVATSPAKRSRFVNEVVQYCLNERFDGIDIDWEHPHNSTEEMAYGTLLADLRKALTPEGLQLTVTVAAWQKLHPAAIAAADFVQVMAYDHDQQHSTFEGAQQDVQMLLNARIPAEKLILGLPFYGRNTETRSALTYAQILADFQPEPATDLIGKMSFNGPGTIRRKTMFAIESKLAGVMIWELGQDAPGAGSLLKVIRDIRKQHRAQ